MTDQLLVIVDHKNLAKLVGGPASLDQVSSSNAYDFQGGERCKGWAGRHGRQR
jgi:hypothetical protein